MHAEGRIVEIRLFSFAGSCAGRSSQNIAGWNQNLPSSGSFAFVPDEPGVYNLWLTCYGGNSQAQVTRLITLTVDWHPTTVSVSVDPGTITVGNQATIHWQTYGSNDCYPDGDWEDVYPRPGSGQGTLSPTQVGTYTYTLTCVSMDNQLVSSSATLEVLPGPAPTVTISASPRLVKLGGTTQLSWSSTNAQYCQANGNWSGNFDTSGSLNWTTTTRGVNTYTLSCFSADGQTATASAYVLVYRGR